MSATGSGKRARGYLFGFLAALSCPCHLPILAVLLAGTAAGAFLSANLTIVALAAGTVFAVSLLVAIRLLASPTPTGNNTRAGLH